MNSLRGFGLIVGALLSWSVTAAEGIDLKTIMQHPDWIGAPVESAWWQGNAEGYWYQVKRKGGDVRDLYAMATDGSSTPVAAKDYPAVDGPWQRLNTSATQLLSIRDGQLLLRQLSMGSEQSKAGDYAPVPTEPLQRLFSGSAPVVDAHFAANDTGVFFLSGNQWWYKGLGAGAAYPVTDLRFEPNPHKAPEPGLAQDQRRLFSTLARDAENRLEQQLEREQRAKAAPETGPAPWYLGDEHKAVAQHLSADGRWLLLVLAPASERGGEPDKMPRFVTDSGYVEIEDVRRLVGRDAPQPQSLMLLDLQTRQQLPIELDLPGRDVDPLAVLKQAQSLPLHDADDPRPVVITDIQWHPEQAQALIQVMAIDHKDRWIVSLNPAKQTTQTLHRLTDLAWINWDFNDMGWVPQSTDAWFLSEQSGYAQLYTATINGKVTQLTHGDFELRSPVWQRDGKQVFVLSNQAHPTEWDLYRIAVKGGRLERVTELLGVESFVLDHSQQRALVRYSEPYIPTQAAVVDLATSQQYAETDTVTEAYRALRWQAPQFVAVPSSVVDLPIWSKFYPADPRFSGPRPAVLFVHGAGYTQNTHHKFPYYFREQMFHNLLTQRGYHVLDMDYRASEGYGRDWRTAIYRQMGTPELEDYMDGVNWLVSEHNADPTRIGIYGGSYGGFMTFMALFKAPEVFKAGAALRPVTDWRHYNHGYTASILNTPEVDPEAHHRSSPIEFAEGLQGHLLISHGMLDDNVFYKDSVRLAQRLIELEKADWELASYPLEPHGYVNPESWLDQYRRILKLFETTIGEGATHH